jgi:hypothetical protein
MVACGAAGGISATFNAPITGVFFGVEIILREFAVDALFTAMLSAMIADAVAIPFLGDKPFLSGFPAGITLGHPRNYLLVAVLAMIAALMGLAFKSVLYKVEDWCDALWKGRPEWLRPAALGAGYGLLLLALPQMYGVDLKITDVMHPFRPALLVPPGGTAHAAHGGSPDGNGSAAGPEVITGPVTGRHDPQALFASESLGRALRQLEVYGRDGLPVLSPDGQRVRGWVTSASVLRALAREISGAHGEAAQAQAAADQDHRDAQDMLAHPPVPLRGYQVIEITITEDSPAAGRKLGDVPWPPASTPVSVLRGRRLHAPRPDSELAPGDRVSLLIPGPQSRRPRSRTASGAISPPAAKAPAREARSETGHPASSRPLRPLTATGGAAIGLAAPGSPPPAPRRRRRRPSHPGRSLTCPGAGLTGPGDRPDDDRPDDGHGYTTSG